MTAVRRFALLAPAALSVACGDAFAPITRLPRELSVVEQDVIQADNQFGVKLFREVNAQDTTGGNVFLSPLSVAMALGMAYNGAAGTTREAMAQTLELQGLDLQQVNEAYRSLIDLLRDLDPRVAFLLANSVWYDQVFGAPLPEFLEATRTYFDAEVAGLDFASPDAAATINGWVNDATRGTIPEIIEAIPEDVIAYLINAIYFKGNWTYRFDKGRTRSAPFERADGSTVQVDMMSYADETPIRFHYDAQLDVEVVDLPYGGGAYSMTIVLPPTAGAIAELAADLTTERWNGWIAALDSTDRHVSMPKYTLEYDLTMNDALAALGMAEAFCEPPPVVADFSNFFPVGPGDICITRVLHKTFVDVNEEGTEAAAATAVEFGPTSAPPATVVDRPFVFAIRERLSGTILFLGKIMDPTT